MIKWISFGIAIALSLLSFEDETGALAQFLFIGTPVVIAFYAIFLYRNRKAAQRFKRTRVLELIFWLVAFWLLPWGALRIHFGEFEVHAALYHMQEGVGSNTPLSMVLATICGALITLILCHAMFTLLRKMPLQWVSLTCASLGLLWINPLNQYYFESFFDQSIANYELPELVEPTFIAAPATPPNLIVIYLEGMERTFRHADQFGDVYAPISRLAGTGTNFESIGQLPMTEWTMAGVVATNCGIPLVPRGFFQHNRAGQGLSFMPSRVCLPDLLQAQGYNTEFLAGNDGAFAGMNAFVYTHGNSNFVDYATLKNVEGRDQDDWHWGVSDANMYTAAKKRVAEFQSENQPYAYFIRTSGPHGPTGHIAKPCLRAGESSETSNILRSVECTANLTEAFVRDILEIVDIDNTLIVLMSDHLAHPFVNETDKLNQFERRNTFFLLGNGLLAESNTKQGTMIDAFPTILDAMGFDLEQDSAGFGVSLLADKPSNFLNIDFNILSRVLRQNVNLAQAIWYTE